MNEEKKYHLINEYLRGNLQGSALDEFRQKMREDTEFAAEVGSQKEIADAIAYVREQELRNLLRQDAEVKYFGNLWGSKWTYASAAIIVLFVSLFFVLRNYLPGNSYETASEDSVQKNLVTIPDTGKKDSTYSDSQTLALNDIPPAAPELEEVEDVIEQDSVVMNAPPFENTGEELTGQETGEAFVEKSDMEVKRDQLISSKVYSVQIITPKIENLDTLNLAKEKPEGRQATTAEVAASDETDKVKAVSKTRNLTVEFWSSPINYKGYNYNGSKLLLYGVSQEASIFFRELDNRLYMNVNGIYYFLDRSGKYLKLVEVTNKTLLNMLNG